MSSIKKTTICLFCLAVILILANTAFGAEDESAEPLLPEGMVIEEAFRPGMGLPVGKILLVQGKVVTVHQDEETGFYAQKNQSIYQGDKIVTLEKGRARIKLNDGSIITLASETKIVINKSVYDPEKKTRSSFVGMDTGKARYLIKKMVDYKNDEFNVKTKTAVAGVRGSEFIIRATDLLTEIITLKDTRLVVISLAMPCKDYKGGPLPKECEPKSIFLKDFEKTIVALGELPADAEIVTPIEIEQLDHDFVITSDISPDISTDIQAGKQTDRETKRAGQPAGTATEEVDIVDGPISVLVPVEEIVPPAEPMEPSAPGLPLPVFEYMEIPQPIVPGEAILEEELKAALPDFPGLPQ